MPYCNAGGHESTEGGLPALLLAVLVADDALDGVGEGTVAGGAVVEGDAVVAAVLVSVDSFVALAFFPPIVLSIMSIKNTHTINVVIVITYWGYSDVTWRARRWLLLLCLLGCLFLLFVRGGCRCFGRGRRWWALIGCTKPITMINLLYQPSIFSRFFFFYLPCVWLL